VTALRLFFEPKFSCTIPHFLNRSHTLYLFAYVKGTQCSETSAFKLQTPDNNPEEIIRQNVGYCFETVDLK
jgi:hypothetical protein